MEINKNKPILSKKGFTLVELLMAMAVSLIILAAVYAVFKISNKNFTTQNVAANVQQSLRSAIGLMARDIRVAGLDPVDSDNFGIAFASPTKIRFTLDSKDPGTEEFNGIVDSTGFEEVTYDFDINEKQILQTLYESTAPTPAAVLIDNITDLTFRYLDGLNADLIDPGLTPPRVPNDKLDEIRIVEISITVQESAGRDEPVSRTLTRRVECRNLAFN